MDEYHDQTIIKFESHPSYFGCSVREPLQKCSSVDIFLAHTWCYHRVTWNVFPIGLDLSSCIRGKTIWAFFHVGAVNLEAKKVRQDILYRQPGRKEDNQDRVRSFMNKGRYKPLMFLLPFPRHLSTLTPPLTPNPEGSWVLNMRDSNGISIRSRRL